MASISSYILISNYLKEIITMFCEIYGCERSINYYKK